jgi:hypothetical protein
MVHHQLYTKAKKLYKNGEIQKIKGWPTINEMRKMKGTEIHNGPLIGPEQTQQTI